MLFGVGVACRILYSIVSYLYVNCSGSITSDGEERANLSTITTCNYVVSVRRGFLFLWVLGMGYVISSPEPKAHLKVYPSSRRPCVRPCVITFKHEYSRKQRADYNEILSEASLGWGKSSDENSHIGLYIMGKTVLPLFLGCFSSDPFHTCRKQ